MDERLLTPMSSLDDTSLDRSQASKQAPVDIAGAPVITTTSNLDLRQSKGELFSKLIERQPQQMIVTTPSKTSSDDNLANSSRNTNDLSRLLAGCRKASSKDDLAEASRSSAAQCNELAHQRGVETFSSIRSRWYSNEEVASILTSFNLHPEWQTNELQVRPKSGAVLLYSREKVRYRQDGYCWKKRKNGRTTREDHMKLKVQGIECIYGCYVHSAILPTFHRRCYWLLENPDIVLVHYLNQPLDDKNKMILTFDPSVLEADTRRRWTNEEIIEEIGSVFGGISQIHHTLNINFPDASNALGGPQTGQNHYCARDALTGLVDLGEFPSNNTNNNQQDDSDQMDMSSADEQMLSHNEFRSTNSGGGYKVQDHVNYSHGANGERAHDAETVDKRKAIGLEYKEAKEEEDGMVVAMNSSPSGPKCGEDKDNEDNNIDIKLERAGQNQTTASATATSSDAMAFGASNVSDGSAQLARDELVARQQSAVDYDLIDPNVVLIDDQDDRRNVLNNSKEYYESSTMTSDRDENECRVRQQHQHRQHEQNPCSPVTQIYNKIVDDIETYVLPLETDQFNPNHHHHHHHDERMHQQDSGIALGAMDTSGELAMGAYERGTDQSSRHQQFVSASTGSSHYGGNHQQNDQHSLALSSCDLFNSCAIDEMSPVGGQLNHRASDNIQREGDMLLSDYNLADSDVASNQINNDDTLTNVDLMMAIQSANDEQDPDGHESQNLLINDSETLDLFSFKQSDLGGRKNQLDVKSTTSDTDTINRLSPMIPIVPRCNSTDNALRSSIINQQQEQYQHRASSHFLHQDTSLNSFSQYSQHNDAHIANCSTTSTEPSNSTSCSASPSSSPLLTTSGGPALGIGCNGDNGDLLVDSYMKPPLQQRQNSEQNEPSNSVLNSLLPKALSLDGSELSSRQNRYNHGHHLQHHNLRTSPLIGSHGLAHSRADHNLRAIYTAHHNHQNPLNHHLLSTGSSIYPSSRQQVSQHHYYQRPSVPSMPPSHFSFDLTSTNKVLVNGGQYRSGSMVAASLSSSSHQQYAQQHQTNVECRRLRQPLATQLRALPVLDYVPNWAPPSGGAKVLLIGNWTSLMDSGVKALDDVNGNSLSSPCLDSAGFSVLFGDLLVAATLIQNNVIRFYSPQHEPGFVPVKVLHKEQVVSEQVLFNITTSAEAHAGAQSDTQATYVFSQNGEQTSDRADGLDNQSTSQAMDSTSIT